MAIYVAVLAAVLGSFGYLYRIRRDNRRSARTLLYVLLELRYSVAKSLVDPKNATKDYFTHFIKRSTELGVNGLGEDTPDEYSQLVESHIKKVIDASITDIEGSLIPEYEKALFEFSKDSPVVAYQLRGREAFGNLIKLTEDYSKSLIDLIEDIEAEEWVKKVILDTQKEIKSESYNELISLLNDDVNRLSRRCSLVDWLRCKYRINSNPSVETLMDFKELDAYIVKLWGNLINAANNGN